MLIYFKNVLWSCVLGRLVCLLLGLPFTAMATAGQRGWAGEGSRAGAGGSAPGGMSRDRAAFFKLLRLQACRALCFWLSPETETGRQRLSGLWPFSGVGVSELLGSVRNLTRRHPELSRNPSGRSSWRLPEAP